MEGNESVLSSYYHYHHHHHNSHATTTASNPTTTNGMFTNTQNHNHNPHVSSPHYTSSEPSPLIFSPHSVTGRGGGGGGGGVLPSSAAASETVKRKRGRPRKYGPPETHSLAKSISSPPHKKNPYTSSSLTSSSKKSQLLALGNAGQGFTPHVITVGAGEDVAQKILSFVQQRKCAVCILSASGSISNASLRQPAMLGGNVTYEGRFEILSLSGSFLHSEIGGASSRTGGISVCLARTDGHIIGGGVGGPLQAAGPVQVIAGSFFFNTSTDAIADKKIEASVDKPPPQVVGASITSVTFRSAPNFPGRISVGERDDHQNIGGNFVLQPQGMDLTSSHLTDWRNGFDVGSGDDIEYDGTDHGECPSPEDGDDEQLDC